MITGETGWRAGEGFSLKSHGCSASTDLGFRMPLLDPAVGGTVIETWSTMLV